MDTSYSLSFTIYVKSGGETTSLDKQSIDLIRDLTIQYSVKSNRKELFSKVTKNDKQSKQLIDKLKRKLPDKELSLVEKEAKLKAIDEEYSIGQIFKDAFNYIKETIMPSIKKGTYKRLIERSVVLFALFFVMYINRFLMFRIDRLIFSVFEMFPLNVSANFISGVSRLIGAALVAPVTEELYKYFTIKINEKEFGWTVFNIGEFRQYVMQTGGFTISNIAMILIRLVCALGHLIYTKIHADEDIKDKYLPSLLHALNNGVASLIIGLLSAGACYSLGLSPKDKFAWFMLLGTIVWEKLVLMYVKMVKRNNILKKETLLIQNCIKDRKTRLFVENYFKENGLTDFFKKVNTWIKSDINDKLYSLPGGKNLYLPETPKAALGITKFINAVTNNPSGRPLALLAQDPLQRVLISVVYNGTVALSIPELRQVLYTLYQAKKSGIKIPKISEPPTKSNIISTYKTVLKQAEEKGLDIESVKMLVRTGVKLEKALTKTKNVIKNIVTRHKEKPTKSNVQPKNKKRTPSTRKTAVRSTI